jgi:TatD DNase family protein
MIKLTFVDTHAHLTLPSLIQDEQQVLERAKREDVDRIITIGVNSEQNHAAIDFANRHKDVYCAIGFHPEEADQLPKNWQENLSSQLKDDKAVALGEIGLDYFRGINDRQLQKKILLEQLELAKQLDLPVILHCREAFDDLFEILSLFKTVKGVLHSFTGNLQNAQTAIELGLLIGLNGIITFPSAKDLQQVVQQISLEKIVLETDSPYLAPQAARGLTNEPQYIPLIAAHLALLKQETIETIAGVTTQNATILFSIK